MSLAAAIIVVIGSLTTAVVTVMAAFAKMKREIMSGMRVETDRISVLIGNGVPGHSLSDDVKAVRGAIDEHDAWERSVIGRGR